MLPANQVCKSLKLRALNYQLSRLLSSNTSVEIKHPHDNQPKKHYDVIIAGGGLVGTTLACCLAKHKIFTDKTVLLLEGGPKFKGFAGEQYGNRVSALNMGTVKLMQSINCWETITSTRYKAVKEMKVWDACSDASIEFNHDHFSNDVAYIVENDLVLHSVYKELDSSNNIEIKNLSKVESVKLPKDGYPNSIVGLKDGDTFSCDLLIGADGANSMVRNQMGVENYSHSYNQNGLVATVELSEPSTNSTAWQRFLPTGPVALLPLNEKMSSVVWSLTPELAKSLLAMPADEFVAALNEAFIKEYPKNSIVSNALNFLDTCMGGKKNQMQYPPCIKNVVDKSRACFPLGFGHASSYVTQGAALIGDAAHRIHPLAGQGVNLGFGDVQCLVNILTAAVYGGARLGDKQHLLKYEQERLMKNFPIMLGVHGLQYLYSTSFSPVVLFRSLGLQITQNVPELKKLFMARAMG